MEGEDAVMYKISRVFFLGVFLSLSLTACSSAGSQNLSGSPASQGNAHAPETQGVSGSGESQEEQGKGDKQAQEPLLGADATDEELLELLGDEVISGIAKAHGVSSAQVILRWNLQKGVVVIPGSSNPDHIKENTELYSFELTDAEMAQINALDRNEKHDWY